MEFLRVLRSESDRDTRNLLIVAVFSGILGILLVALIVGSAQKVSPGQLDTVSLVTFIFCLVAYVFARRYVAIQSSALAERVVMKMRLRILEKIRFSDLLHYEQLGRSQIYSALNESAITLASGAAYIASGFSSSVMLFFAMFYVAYLSVLAFVMTLAIIVIGIIWFFHTRERLNKQLSKSSEKETEFLALVQHLLDGFKEVKINRPRSDDLYGNYTVPVADQARNLKLESDRSFAWMSAIGQNFLYVLLAVTIFVLPALSVGSSENVVQVATAIIFIMGPLGEVVGSVPVLMRSNAAIENIRRLESTLDVAGLEAVTEDVATEVKLRSFRHLSLRGISFAYERRLGNEAFKLGPLDLTIQANELLFFIGGNGSGKSTMLKIITGLYAADTGSILVDDQVVYGENLPAYRTLFSIIFTDFHLFDRLYGLKNVTADAVEQLLVEMRIRDATGVKDGRFTNLNLSTGQKKRLALTVALLEQRPILVFDEVAADQDPGFRKYFYEVLLRRWQSQGKTIIVVTHDDHYFHVADRVLKMEFGQLEEYSV